MPKRILMFAVLLVVLTLMLGTGSAVAGTSISFWTFGSETPELKAVMDEFRADFLKETGISVEWRMIGWGDYHQSNLSVISSRKGPDVTQIGTTTVAQQAMAGVFEELSSLYNELGGEQLFFPSAVSTTKPDGMKGYYAIPWSGSYPVYIITL